MKIRFGMVAGLLLVGPSTAMASQRECPEGMFSFGFTECAPLGSFYSRYGWGQADFLKFSRFAVEDFIATNARTPNGKNDPPGNAYGLEKNRLTSDSEGDHDDLNFKSWFDLENPQTASSTEGASAYGDGSSAFSDGTSTPNAGAPGLTIAQWGDPVTTNPEPASVILLATGFATVFGVARRRRNSSPS